MDKIRKIFILLYGLAIGMQVQAQDKIVNPDISYAGTPRTLTIGGINVSGVEGYEDYVLTGISGLSVGEQVEVPGDDITNAVKRYWKHGLFSKVAVAADSTVVGIVAHYGHLVALWQCGILIAAELRRNVIVAKLVLRKRIATTAFLREFKYQITI